MILPALFSTLCWAQPHPLPLVAGSIQRTQPSRVDEWPGEPSDFHGHPRHDFDFQGARATVVLPRRAAMGRPWIWRARFFGHEPQTDVALLQRGFHLAYVDVGGLFGNDVAVERWRRFHAHLVEQHGFSPRPIVEAMSRGGLIALRFAASFPGSVAGLYLDAPVCDIESWPGGKGSGKGSPADWQACMEAFGIDETNPSQRPPRTLDLVPQLARGRVPILVVAGTADEVVPIAENTDVLEQRMREEGGSIEVIRKDGVGHHPHSLEDPAPIVDFALRHGLRSEHYARLRRGLPRLKHRLSQQDDTPIRVAFLGGSITAMHGWRDHVGEALRERHPRCRFEFVAAGIPSLDSTAHAFRLHQDVLASGPIDLLFVEAAVNDLHNGRDATERIRGMEGVVRHFLRRNPGGDLMMLHFIDPRMMDQYRAGEVPPTIASHERVAEHYRVNSLHLAREVTERIDAGQFSWQHDFKDLHPSPFGHRVYADSILTAMETALRWPVVGAPERDRSLPAPLDPACYQTGTLVAPDAARRDGGFQLDPAWKPSDGKGTRPGFVDIPAAVGEEPGARLTFPFQGEAVGLWVVAGPDAGVIEVQVDELPPRRIDLFTRWSAGLHLPWVHVIEAGLLPGPHTLRLEIAEQKSERSTGHAVRVVHFLVNESADGE